MADPISDANMDAVQRRLMFEDEFVLFFFIRLIYLHLANQLS